MGSRSGNNIYVKGNAKLLHQTYVSSVDPQDTLDARVLTKINPKDSSNLVGMPVSCRYHRQSQWRIQSTSHRKLMVSIFIILINGK